MMFCSQCGSPVGEGKKFCAKCGAPQIVSETQARPEQSYAPAAQPDYRPATSQTPPVPMSTQPPVAQSPTMPTYAAPAYADQPAQSAYTPPGYTNQPAEPAHGTLPVYTSQSSQPAYSPPGNADQPIEPTYTPAGYSSYPAQPAYPESPGYQAPDSGPAQTEPPKKKGVSKLVKIGVPIVAVLAVAVVAYFLLFVMSSPMATAKKALTGLGTETVERFNSTPLKVFGMLSDTMKDGVLTIDVKFEDTWYDEEVDVNVKLSTNAEEKESSLEADISVYGNSFDIAAYVNKERVAVGSKAFDANYYGIRYSTFRKDIRSFGGLVGLDDQTMDTLADLVELIDDLMNKEKTENAGSEAYTNLITEFVQNLEPTSGNADIYSGGENVRCKKIEFVVTDKQIVKLLNDLYKLVENDESIRSGLEDVYDNPFFSNVGIRVSYDDVLKEMRSAFDEFEDNFEGGIICSLYIGSKDRLLRLEVAIDQNKEDDESHITGSFDFGASAQDRWVFEVSITDKWEDESHAKLVWDYRERGSGIENALTFSTDDDDDSITLKSVWSQENGRFTLSFTDEYGDTSELTGVLKTEDKGFRLTLDNPYPDYSDEILTIVISASPGANIKQIDYINIDKWGRDLLDKLEEFMYNLS